MPTVETENHLAQSSVNTFYPPRTGAWLTAGGGHGYAAASYGKIGQMRQHPQIIEGRR
jgi:hypothetical protein